MMGKIVMSGLAVQSEKYGIGHAVRLSNLLSASEKLGWSASQFDLTLLTGNQNQVSALISEIKNSDCLVLDIDPRFAADNLDFLSQILSAFKETNCALILFDSRTNFPIRQVISQIKFDLTICPYGLPGVEITKNEIVGFGATIFDDSLRDLQIEYKVLSREPNNFLIACGGSDPLNISTLYLRALNQLDFYSFHIRIVIGPHFLTSNFTDLEREVEKSRHQIEFINSPQNLTSSYLEADIALVTGGLTRSEVLFLGIPTVVTDLNIEQEISTQFFESAEGLLRAGTYSEGEQALIEGMRKKILKLLSSQTVREKMSSNARILMPGGGCEIILREIEQTCIRKRQL